MVPTTETLKEASVNAGLQTRCLSPWAEGSRTRCPPRLQGLDVLLQLPLEDFGSAVNSFQQGVVLTCSCDDTFLSLLSFAVVTVLNYMTRLCCTL